ncbi:MAG TPA: hypothetical protein VNW68_03795 [Candidatus Limnocylindria bacterium]|nr:hypothetical protein [Candidatus Limnocylindria bacterium]
MADESIGALIERLARQAGEVTATDTPAGRAYSRTGQPFALVATEALELRLRPDIAEAARRTPATSASDRGPEWIRFAPPTIDRHALDRAAAWFLIAWRAAGDA